MQCQSLSFVFLIPVLLLALIIVIIFFFAYSFTQKPLPFLCVYCFACWWNGFKNIALLNDHSTNRWATFGTLKHTTMMADIRSVSCGWIHSGRCRSTDLRLTRIRPSWFEIKTSYHTSTLQSTIQSLIRSTRDTLFTEIAFWIV